MKISRKDLVLVGLDLLLDKDGFAVSYTKDDLALALDIEPSTLGDYLTALKKSEFIEKSNRKYVKDLNDVVTLTEKGKEQIEIIREGIELLVMTPEHHNIPSIIKVSLILDRLKDPLEKLFFLSVYLANREFDLFMFLEAIRVSRADSNIINLFSDMEVEEKRPSRIPFIVTFSKTSFHGGLNEDIMNKDGWTEKDPNNILVIAEVDQKQGRLNDAMTYYDLLLSPGYKLTQNQWFLAKMGKVHTYRKMGDTKKALKILEDTTEITENRMFNAYCKQVKALIFSMLGQFDDSLKLYNSSIRSFHSYGLPLMLSIAYNNRGTLYYRMEDYENALDDWKKARRFASEAKSEYCESAIVGNLADIFARKGDFKKALSYLNKAEKNAKNMGDLEMTSSIFYNYALVYVLMKDINRAVDAFKVSETVAFPLPSPLEKAEYRRCIISIAKENSLGEIENLI